MDTARAAMNKLVGSTVKSVKVQDDGEVVIELLKNGLVTSVATQSDPEGNGPGCLAVWGPGISTILGGR